MSTAASIGYGYTIGYSATSGGTYTNLAEVLDVKPGKKTGAKVEVLSNTSANFYPDKIPGVKSEGDWDVKLVYAAGGRAAIDALFMVPQYFKFIRPNGTTTQTFFGFICEIGDEVPLKEAMTVDIKIAVSQNVVFAS